MHCIQFLIIWESSKEMDQNYFAKLKIDLLLTLVLSSMFFICISYGGKVKRYFVYECKLNPFELNIKIFTSLYEDLHFYIDQNNISYFKIL